ncbi:hypothetical protein GH714_012878 [Hevea brasiliensis]|uniref:Uncharacterized protein n=1 Tax=Hevea brasiliensis TaxID=3981 RepID=A0A6A6NCU0_HEVBR|nr:hypothetical protein GH714_012878 [Hevea brasiliensis]
MKLMRFNFLVEEEKARQGYGISTKSTVRKVTDGESSSHASKGGRRSRGGRGQANAKGSGGPTSVRDDEAKRDEIPTTLEALFRSSQK